MLIHVCYLPNIGTYEDTPKTKTSKRVIKVGEDVMEILREYKKWQESEAIKLGDKRKSTNRLFTAWNGEDINPGTVTKWFKKIATDIGVPEATIHSF